MLVLFWSSTYGVDRVKALPGIISFVQVDPYEDFPVLPNEFPIDRGKSGEIMIQGCAGERVNASLVIRSDKKNYENLRIDQSSFSNRDLEIDGAMDVRIVKPWFQSVPIKGKRNYHTRSKQRQRKLIPELLLHDESIIKVDIEAEKNFAKIVLDNQDKWVDISTEGDGKGQTIPEVSEFPIRDEKVIAPFSLYSGESKQLFITISIPEWARPGIYGGSIKIDSWGGEPVAEIPVRLRVFRFRLEESELEYSIFYRSKLHKGDGTISSEWKNDTQLRAELKDMVAKGIRNPSVYQDPKYPSEFLEYMKVRKETGAYDEKLFILSAKSGIVTSRSGLAKLEDKVAWLRRTIGKYGFRVPVLYGKDEAKGEEITQQLGAWRAVRAAGGQNFSAGYRGHTERADGLTNYLVLHGEPDEKEIERAHASGTAILSYSNPQAGADIPLLFRRNYGVQLWKTGMDGAMPYAYQMSAGFIWNDFDHHRYKDHALTYPTVDGFVSTLSWEAYGDAVQDTRYLQTLASHLKKYQSRLPKNLLRKGDRFFKELMSVTEISPSSVRRSAANLIEELHEYIETTTVTNRIAAID
jgi:hypothetical protein